VLHKPGALSGEERALIEEHPVLGSEMVASIGNQQVTDAVRHHHERWDGHGYPDGKAGGDIPLYARVIAVSDSYDAIRSNRSYRRGASRDDAVQILTDESGHQFDPGVVEAFLKTLPARAPAVAFLSSLATGPSALWRYLQQLFQRFGSTALAPAIGAAGTAIVVGSTSLFGAGTPSPAAPLAAATEGSASPGGTASPRETPSSARGEGSGTRASGDSAEPKRDKRRKNTAQKKKGEQKGGGTSGGSTSPGSDGQDGPAPAQEEPTTSGTSAGDGTSGSGTPAGDGTSGSDTSGGDSAEVKGDPNPEGKDCKAGKPQSKGSRRHCG
jgi:hypothetical protein